MKKIWRCHKCVNQRKECKYECDEWVEWNLVDMMEYVFEINKIIYIYTIVKLKTFFKNIDFLISMKY